MRASSLTLPIQFCRRKSILTRSGDVMASVNRPELKVASAVPSDGKESEIRDRLHAAGARHVLHQDRRRAGQMRGQMSLHQPRIGVGAAARRQADNDAHRLAGKEGCGVFGMGGLNECGEHQSARPRESGTSALEP